MDALKEEQFSSTHLGHLGLVADKIDSLNIVNLIDNRLPISKVSFRQGCVTVPR